MMKLGVLLLGSIRIITSLFILSFIEHPHIVSAHEDGELDVHFEARLGHKAPISSATASADGKLIATASDDHTIILWEADTGAQLRRFVGHRGPVKSVVFSFSGNMLLTSSDDGTAKLWEASTGQELRQFYGFGMVELATFSPDARYVLVVRSVDTMTKIQPRNRLAIVNGGADLDDDSEGDTDWRLSGSVAQVFEVETGTELGHASFTKHLSSIKPAVFSPDGHSILIVAQGGARLWRIGDKHDQILIRKGGRKKGSIGQPAPSDPEVITSGVFSPDGERIMLISNAGIRLWDKPSQKEIWYFATRMSSEGHFFLPTSAAFSPDGQIILTVGWDFTPPKYDKGRQAAALSLNAVITVWNTENREEIRQFGWRSDSGIENYTSTLGGGLRLVFSPDGLNILTINKEEIRLWEISTGVELRRFKGHKDHITSAEFSLDGRSMLTGSRDRTARLWDTSTGHELKRFEAQDGQNTSPIFKDGRGNGTNP